MGKGDKALRIERTQRFRGPDSLTAELARSDWGRFLLRRGGELTFDWVIIQSRNVSFKSSILLLATPERHNSCYGNKCLRSDPLRPKRCANRFEQLSVPPRVRRNPIRRLPVDNGRPWRQKLKYGTPIFLFEDQRLFGRQSCRSSGGLGRGTAGR